MVLKYRSFDVCRLGVQDIRSLDITRRGIIQSGSNPKSGSDTCGEYQQMISEVE